ncbi:hypothetical protein MTO96_024406 [Rhipicephalus appendiculatus]
MLFEDETTVKEKCNQLALASTNLRKGMALLLVNSHLGDFSTNSSCKGQGEKDREDPFWRIRVIKSELKIPAREPRATAGCPDRWISFLRLSEDQCGRLLLLGRFSSPEASYLSIPRLSCERSLHVHRFRSSNRAQPCLICLECLGCHPWGATPPPPTVRTRPLPTRPIYTPSPPTRPTPAPTRPTPAPTSPPTIPTEPPTAAPPPSPTRPRPTARPTTRRPPTTTTTTTTTSTTTTTTTTTKTTTTKTTTTKKTTTKKTTTKTTTTTTTTLAPFSVDQLICTVSGTAVFQKRVPPDGLCHFVYYADVVIVKGELVPIKNNLSWVTFKDTISTFKKTSGGIGFDVRYVSGMDLDAGAQNLGKLNSKNVKNYGILNAIEASTKLKGVYNKAKDLLKKLKSFQAQDNTRKTLLAFGIYNYLGENAWATLQEVFTSAINDAVADTVIAYSSVGWIERPSDCFSHPPSIFNMAKYTGEAAKEAGRAPDILTVSKMMTRDKKYNSGVKMGLSFELGTLVYRVKKAAINFDMVNVACKTMYITNMDIVPCKVNIHFLRNELYEGVNVGEVKGHNTTVLLFEDDNTLTEKCKQLALPTTNLRHGMALLLVNAHLGDFSADSPCKGQGEKDREDPFWRIRAMKTQLKIP